MHVSVVLTEINLHRHI